MGRERDPWYHDHSVRNLGCEPGSRSRLYLLRWRRLTPTRSGDRSKNSDREFLLRRRKTHARLTPCLARVPAARATLLRLLSEDCPSAGGCTAGSLCLE